MEVQESKQKNDQPRIVEQTENPLVALFESKLRKFCKLTKKEQEVQLSKLAEEFYETCMVPLISQIAFRDEAIQYWTNLLGRMVSHLRSWADHRRKGWTEALHLIKEVQKTISLQDKKREIVEKARRQVVEEQKASTENKRTRNEGTKEDGNN